MRSFHGSLGLSYWYAVSLDHAIVAWRRLLGEAAVSTNTDELAGAERATFATTVRVSAVLRPTHRDHVRAILVTAAEHGVPVSPVSRGKNWGLGSRVPATDAVLLDLSGLDRIVNYDETMATLTVEPGVTFQQAYEFLKSKRSPLFLNSTGASPHASLVGNALDRGDGSGPYGDRVHHMCDIEAVLGTGDVVHTGFGRFGSSRLRGLHRFGVGPALDGLFSQGNLAVVTQATFWLAPLPKYLGVVRFSVASEDRLAALVDGLRQLRLDGTLTSVAGLWNDYRVVSAARVRGGGATTDALTRDRLRELPDAPQAQWFGTAGLYAASLEQGRAQAAHVRSVLGQLVDTLRIEARSGEPRAGAELFSESEPAFQFLQGVPHEQSLRSVYWRKPAIPDTPTDPEGDGCGVIWVCPTVPLRGSDVAEVTAAAEQLMLRNGFEPLLALVAQTERVGYLIPLIVYDRSVAGDDERAMACHDELLACFCKLGCIPYRLGIQAMNGLPAAQDDYAAVLKRLKQTLDPEDVLAPGRYDFRSEWP